MPVYEYKCLSCGEIIEEFQQINEEPLNSCPKCSGNLKRLISLNDVNVIYNNSREHYEKEIKPEAKRIAERIKAGDENAAADIFGSK